MSSSPRRPHGAVIVSVLLAVLVAGAVLVQTRGGAAAGATETTETVETTSEAAHDGDGQRAAVDHGHEPLQPAYVGGRVAQYRFAPVEPGTDTGRARILYEVEYPDGWEAELARPLCDYCDHGGNGRDAYDFHDHVLTGLPTPRDNAAGRVYWEVVHVAPAVSGDAEHDAAVAQAYAEALPATSTTAVRRLLAQRLPDGSPVAAPQETGYVFAGPLTRFPFGRDR